MVFVFLFLLCYPYTHKCIRLAFRLFRQAPFSCLPESSSVPMLYCVITPSVSFSFHSRNISWLHLMPNQEEEVKLAISRFMNFKLIQHSNLTEFAALKRLQEIESCDRLNDECENKKETERKSTNCKSICTGLLSFITRIRFLSSAQTFTLYVVI